FIINVDGRYHYETSASWSDSDFMAEFKTLKYSEIHKAKKTSLIYTGLKEKEEYEKDITWEEEKAITYPKEIITNSNNKYKINKVERDSSKVKFFIESNNPPVDLFTRLTLVTNDEKENSFWFGTMYKGEDNNYIVEFNDVNKDCPLKLSVDNYWKEKNIEDSVEI
ncbi:hypothetical protein, partial [Clostridium perfringens]